MSRPTPFLAVLLAAACAQSPILDGPTLGEDPNLQGPNVTAEIQLGQFFTGPGDKVLVRVWGHDDLSTTYEVDVDGTIHPFLLGTVPVEGLTVAQVRERLLQGYSRYLVDPSLDVAVQGSTDRKVTVLGDVNRAGVYPLTNPRTTVVDMIATAGGVSLTGDTTGVVVARNVDGQWQVNPYNLDMLFEPDDPSVRTEIPYVHPGDYIWVVRSPLEEFSDHLDVVTNALRALNFAERGIILTPRTSDALDF